MQIDWPGIRAAAVALGSVRDAAIKAAGTLISSDERNRFVERVNKRAYRERWLPKASEVQARGSSVQIVQNGADTLANTLSERKDATKLHLSKYVVDASKRAAGSNGNLKIAPRVREVAQVAGHVWPEVQGDGDTINLQVLSIGGAVNLSKK